MKINQNSIFVDGPSGKLEAILLTPKENLDITHVCVFCHPHPLKEGTMHNKVVTTVARALAANGVAVLVFNFRGVGKSDGEYAYAKGETEDCLAAINYIKGLYSKAKLWLGGFSFGSYVALCAHSQVDTEKLILIAPPVPNFDFTAPMIKSPILVIQGESDEVIDAESVYKWYNSIGTTAKKLIKVDTGHFFHGKLVELKGLIECEFTTKREL